MEVSRPNAWFATATLAAVLLASAARAQSPSRGQPPNQPERASDPFPQDQPQAGNQQAEQDLRQGIELTSRGQFQQAIPHFLAARGRVVESFPLEFNLALCYVGTRQFPKAIDILSHIRGRRSNVKNLLAQAYIGAHQPDDALKAFEEGVAIAPRDESLYLQVSETCFDEGLYDLGSRVLAVGLENLPDSAPLHFERGVFRVQQDDNEQADQDFEAARKLAPDSQIAYISSAEQAFISGRVEDVIRFARAGIRAGYTHYLLLTMLGEALLRAGATPSTPAEFDEAQQVLERAVAEQPGYSSAHIALGRIYLMRGQLPDALAQLEAGRRLDPHDKAVYPPLAAAYRRSGEPEKANAALAVLEKLNREDENRIRSGEGGHAGYLSGKPLAGKK
jgi:tetratricopeptide (TPR) repeat protein